jgi:hypothetical protein
MRPPIDILSLASAGPIRAGATAALFLRKLIVFSESDCATRESEEGAKKTLISIGQSSRPALLTPSRRLQ